MERFPNGEDPIPVCGKLWEELSLTWHVLRNPEFNISGLPILSYINEQRIS